MGMMNNETKIPETTMDHLKEVAEMDFEKIQKSELTYDEAVTEFKKCNRFVCKILLGLLVTPEEEKMLNMEYAKELKKLVDKANEKPEPEEKKSEKDFDYYVNKCANRCLSFALRTDGDDEIVATMTFAYASALVDIGILTDETEDIKRFGSAVMEKMMIASLLK